MIPFVGARNGPVTDTIDYEIGGQNINNPSGGINLKPWTGRLISPNTPASHITLEANGVPAVTVLTAPNMKEFSFTFDQNMQPIIAYVDNTGAKIYYYDSTTSQFETKLLETGAVNPKLTFDDKRNFQGYIGSDVICAYILGGNLVQRLGSERFTNLHTVVANVGTSGLVKIGMNTQLRMQYRLK